MEGVSSFGAVDQAESNFLLKVFMLYDFFFIMTQEWNWRVWEKKNTFFNYE